jgi:nitrite reductase/ring-hydroxylating ferredoxin subunit
MALVKVASAGDLKPNQMKAVDADGKPVLLVNLNGTFYAIGNKCTHSGCRLSNGTLKGDTVQCGCHGSIFDAKTGNVVKGPAKNAEPKYEVKIENDQVIIST